VDDGTTGSEDGGRRYPEIRHAWGGRVHLLDDPVAWSLLARLGHPETRQPEVGRLVRRLYEALAWTALAAELPRVEVDVPTRMRDSVPGAAYRGPAIDRSARAVSVAIHRAGTVPSQIVYETLNELLDPEGVRQDHIVMSRQTDAEGRVTGVSFGDSKVGQEVDGRTIVLPDPMGATGSSMSAAIGRYRELGTPARVVALHLIVTPEYLRRLRTDHPDAIVYAYRYDRGLSPPAALAALPGTHAAERGLDDRQYIVPGAGGLGELLNNAWV
jgi:uracil phosphoribosyltransferase